MGGEKLSYIRNYVLWDLGSSLNCSSPFWILHLLHIARQLCWLPLMGTEGLGLSSHEHSLSGLNSRV